MASNHRQPPSVYRRGHLQTYGSQASPLLIIAILAACSDESGIEQRGNVDASSGSTGASGGSFSQSDSELQEGGASSKDPTLGSVGGTTGNGETPEACVGDTAEASLQDIRLAFLLDRSGSMGDNNPPPGTGYNHDRSLKWDPITAALKGFFAAPASAEGAFASLSFFPNSSSSLIQCDPNSYARPAVPFTSLPNEHAFAQAIDAVEPNLKFTPTHTALKGTFEFIAEQASDPKTIQAVVLVTDGTPTQPQCSEKNNVAGVSELARSWSDRVLTFAIGVGDVGGLNEIAVAGGTERAFIVPANDADAAQQEFNRAVEEIRGIISCTLELPPPPGGKQLDPKAVNVSYATNQGEATRIAQDQGCESGAGWQYDDPDSPTMLELCASTCTKVRSLKNVALSVEFGCTTQVR